jgi:hypothetical protein
MSSEGMSPHGQEGAYEQNPGGPSRAAQQPLLRATVFNDQTGRPISWMCSVCETIFALDRVDEILTKRSADKINKDFEMHCKGKHPGSQVIGLDIPREDFSQSAARIVRQATEEK